MRRLTSGQNSWKVYTFLRNELCSNNLSDFGLKKSLGNLDAVREKFLAHV